MIAVFVLPLARDRNFDREATFGGMSALWKVADNASLPLKKASRL